ncbi:MAG: anhydro-N-acetylmuramic acid kinase [Myxococcaceae bacterium]|nr:anhydro-N-acetylmuramic acid kinase [Myxococcaceae bacterium]
MDSSAGRIVIGLISGTSADAVEAAACRVWGTGVTARLELLGHVSAPLPRAVRERIWSASTAEALSLLNVELGEHFARAAEAVLRHAGLDARDVAAVGSHGQTVAHQKGATLQLGEASVIAERLGCPVVCDFRVRDVAAGGQGAPLVPYADWVLFRAQGRVRALQNIGGIANVSVVSERLEDTLAFDTGPGNMLLDALVRRHTRGARTYDDGGRLAARGTVDAPLLRELCRLPALKRKPPRSFGRVEFGEALADALWRKHRRRPLDLLATITAYTVEATAQAYRRFILPGRELEGVWLSGGGSRNPLLVDGLRKALAPLPVHPLDSLGFPEGAKEAACFALLASEHLAGTPQNVPSATGARRPVVLGKLVPG